MYMPLRAPDADVPVDLQAVLDQCYANGGYDDLIDYDQPPRAKLGPEEQFWMNAAVRGGWGRGQGFRVQGSGDNVPAQRAPSSCRPSPRCTRTLRPARAMQPPVLPIVNCRERGPRKMQRPSLGSSYCWMRGRKTTVGGVLSGGEPAGLMPVVIDGVVCPSLSRNRTVNVSSIGNATY